MTLSNDYCLAITVDYQTTAGTATSGTDYTATGETLTFSVGQTSKTVTVSTVEDAIYEYHETFSLDLSSPSNATISDSSGTGTITNDETVPQFSIADNSAEEGSGLDLVVTMDKEASMSVTIDLDTSGSTATSGVDYTATGVTLTFTAGSTGQTVTVQTTEDATYEGNENFYGVISNASTGTISDATATATITDDESQPTISISDENSNEGDQAIYTITLSTASDQTITVDYDTLADGTATSGVDYTHTGGTVTITAGNTTGTLTVNTIEDGDHEANETYSVILSNPSNATITDATGAGTITEDDGQPVITMGNQSAAEGDSIPFLPTLSHISYENITFDYITQMSGEAISGVDYIHTGGTITITSGNLTGTFNVNTIEDIIFEYHEDFVIVLSNPSNATISGTVVSGTVRNDEAVPGFSVSDESATE